MLNNQKINGNFDNKETLGNQQRKSTLEIDNYHKSEERIVIFLKNLT
jgi:hypothetical protein